MVQSLKITSILVLSLLIASISTPLYAAKITSGRQGVDSAGTAEQLSATSTRCDLIYVTAFEANTDIIVIGSSSVDATEATRNGTVLFAGQTIAFPQTNLVALYIDSEVNDEGASFNCIDR